MTSGNPSSWTGIFNTAIVREILGNIKHTNIHIIEIPEGEK